MDNELAPTGALVPTEIVRCLFHDAFEEEEYAIHCTGEFVPPPYPYGLRTTSSEMVKYKEALATLGIVAREAPPILSITRPLYLEEVHDREWVQKFARVRRKTVENTPAITEALDEMHEIALVTSYLQKHKAEAGFVMHRLVYPFYDGIGKGLGVYKIAFIHYLVERYSIPLDTPVAGTTLGEFLKETKSMAERAQLELPPNLLASSFASCQK